MWSSLPFFIILKIYMKVKVFLLIIITSCVFYNTNGQLRILNEPLQLHNAQPNYSARFTAVGGAFTALGADVSSLYQNPAGLAMYRSFEIFYGPGLSFKNTSSNFNGSTTETNNFLYEGGSGGLVITSKRNNSKLKYINYGFAFHRSKSNNFTKAYKGLDEYINEYGYPEVFELEETIETKGSRYSELAFAAAGNYNDKLFFGVNITTPRYIYNQRFDFMQRDIENQNSWDEIIYSDTDSISTENSINIGLGFVYKLNKNFRIGANAKSASMLTVQEDFFSSEVIIYDDGSEVAEPREIVPPLFYFLNAPPKIDVGLSYLNSKGFIAIDAGYIFNNNIRYLDESFDEDFFLAYNFELSNLIKNSFVFRIGGEFVPTQNLRLRAGYNITTSPVQNNDIYSGTQNISAGAGIRKAVFETEESSRTVFADATLKYSFYKSQYEIYEGLENGPFVDFKYNQLQLITTFGFKF